MTPSCPDYSVDGRQRLLVRGERGQGGLADEASEHAAVANAESRCGSDTTGAWQDGQAPRAEHAQSRARLRMPSAPFGQLGRNHHPLGGNLRCAEGHRPHQASGTTVTSTGPRHRSVPLSRKVQARRAVFSVPSWSRCAVRPLDLHSSVAQFVPPTSGTGRCRCKARGYALFELGTICLPCCTMVIRDR
jgi:hypothetical protein